VTGIDVEDTVLARARTLVERAGLGDRIGLATVAPGLTGVGIRDRNPWYREAARAELDRLSGPSLS